MCYQQALLCCIAAKNARQPAHKQWALLRLQDEAHMSKDG